MKTTSTILAGGILTLALSPTANARVTRIVIDATELIEAAQASAVLR